MCPVIDLIDAENDVKRTARQRYASATGIDTTSLARTANAIEPAGALPQAGFFCLKGTVFTRSQIG